MTTPAVVPFSLHLQQVAVSEMEVERPSAEKQSATHRSDGLSFVYPRYTSTKQEGPENALVQHFPSTSLTSVAAIKKRSLQTLPLGGGGC